MHHSTLLDFEEDLIEDFEGHDMIDEPEYADLDEDWRLNPPRGAGEFARLKCTKGKKYSKKLKKCIKKKKKSIKDEF